MVIIACVRIQFLLLMPHGRCCSIQVLGVGSSDVTVRGQMLRLGEQAPVLSHCLAAACHTGTPRHCTRRHECPSLPPAGHRQQRAWVGTLAASTLVRQRLRHTCTGAGQLSGMGDGPAAQLSLCWPGDSWVMHLTPGSHRIDSRQEAHTRGQLVHQ